MGYQNSQFPQQKTGDPDFFGSLSLSLQKVFNHVWSFQPFWRKLSSWDSIISYPILRIQTQKLNARIPMNDTSSSQFLLGPAVYCDHFCHDSVWRNPAHIFTYSIYLKNPGILNVERWRLSTSTLAGFHHRGRPMARETRQDSSFNRRILRHFHATRVQTIHGTRGVGRSQDGI